MPIYKRKNVSPVYFPALDAEHQVISTVLEELRLTVAAGAPVSVLQAAVERLAKQAAAHFAYEERMMRASRYYGYAWHLQSHDAARKRVRIAADRAGAGDAKGVFELVDFCQGWLRDHTGLHDRMMSAYLRGYQREGGQLPS
jgi:hemerythrin